MHIHTPATRLKSDLRALFLYGNGMPVTNTYLHVLSYGQVSKDLVNFGRQTKMRSVFRVSGPNVKTVRLIFTTLYRMDRDSETVDWYNDNVFLMIRHQKLLKIKIKVKKRYIIR